MALLFFVVFFFHEDAQIFLFCFVLYINNLTTVQNDKIKAREN